MPGNILIIGSPEGLEEFGQLAKLGWRLYSSRNVIKFFAERGVKCHPVGVAEGCPRRLAGHLVPSSRIIAGIMANRESLGDMQDIEDLGIVAFDVVVIDPNSNFIRQLDGKPSFDIGSIDVEPSILILSAIQNSRWVTPVVSEKDRDCVIHEIVKDGEVCLLTKQVLASNALAWLSSNTKFLSDVVHHHIGRKQPIFEEGFVF